MLLQQHLISDAEDHRLTDGLRHSSPSSTRRILVHAPAKLNLYLEVLGKRADGYHELETLMVMVGIYDELSFAPNPSGQISLSVEVQIPHEFCAGGIPPVEQNLVWKGAMLLKQRYGISDGVTIHLRKRIPLASGLAGGSTDCAATLAGLNHLWNLGLDRQELMAVGAELGSDVPFFFSATPAAICRGRGELVTPLPVGPALHFVIVRPETGLSTAEVFRSLKLSDTPRSIEHLHDHWRNGHRAGVLDQLWNRLQQPAEELNSEIRELRKRFTGLPVLAHQMSGSGTSYFGVCGSRRQARHLASRLRASTGGRILIAGSQA